MASQDARALVAQSPAAVEALADMAALWREAASRAAGPRLAGVADAVAACWEHAHAHPTRDAYIAALTASRVILAKHPELDLMMPVPSWASRRARRFPTDARL